jgi:peptidoglycan biosynthesis protein MviN/MurJ (putative lipid II flippase)
MATGGFLAILIASRFGSTAETDGFFAAYGIYGVVVLLAQSTRLTLVPRLLGGTSRFERFDNFLGTAVVIWLATGVVFVAAGAPLADLLTGQSTARDAAQEALLILFPATAAQLFAALAAAMLGVLGHYLGAAAVYAAGSIATLLCYLALVSSLGVRAVPVALLCGSFATALPLLWQMVAAGWRPRLASSAGGAVRRVGLLLAGASSIAVPQILYVITLSFASGIGEGAATVYSYAFFALGVVVASVASSVSIVLAAPLAATWDRRPSSLRIHVDRSLRFSLLLLAPVAAAAALIGDDAASFVLRGFTDSEIQRTVECFLLLFPAILAAMATAIPLIALYALERHNALAAITVPVIACHVVVSMLAVELDGLLALAGAASLSAVLFAGGIYRLLYGRAAGNEAAHVGWETLRVGVPAATCFVVPALAGAPDVVTLVVGCALFAVFVGLALPQHRALALRVARAHPAGDS